MKVTTLTFKVFCSNTYVIGEEGSPCVLIDPGYKKDDYFYDYVQKHHNGNCLGIILTHTHCDHFEGLQDSKLLDNTPVFVHRDDEEGLYDKYFNLSKLMDKDISLDVTPNIVNEDDEIKLGEFVFKVIHTPFHSPGSMCLYVEKEGILFSGDTLFNRDIGRSDFKTSCPRFTEQSLRKLAKLPPETVVYPGHGRATTIDVESNYGYLRGLK